MEWKNWVDVREKGLALGYFDHLKVIHFNNSKYETGLGKDRHANIFDHGYITVAAFDELFDTPELAAIPFILERSEEHTSELQSRFDLVCRLLLVKNKI